MVINSFQVVTGQCIYTSGKSGYPTILDGYAVGKNLGGLDTAPGSSSNSYSTNEYQKSSYKYQTPSSCYHKTSVDYQLSSSVYQKSSNDYEVSSSVYQKSSNDYEVSSSVYQKSSNDYQVPSSGYQVGSNGYKTAANDHTMTKGYQTQKASKPKHTLESSKKSAHSHPKMTYDSPIAELTVRNEYFSPQSATELLEVFFSPLRSAAKSGREGQECRGLEMVPD